MNLKEQLVSIANEYNIQSPIVVSDSAANIKKAIRIAEWDRFPCMAHMINLAVKNAIDNKEDLPTVKSLIDKCKTIVGHFSHSVAASNDLKEAAEARGNGSRATALIQEVILHKIICFHVVITNS